jgi:hypothetical protein
LDSPPTSASLARALRLVDVAVRALPQLRARLDAAPADADALSALGRADLLDAAAAFVAPTGQVAFAGTLAGSAMPALLPAEDLDSEWLTVVAAVRPTLSRLEVHQLTHPPLAGWTNRPGDPWQTTASDPRRLLAVFATPGLDLAGGSATTTVAACLLDRFTEVVPAADQRTGAAFGFDAPASRAPQAILLAVPPNTDAPLDQQTLADIVVDTRRLAHARMARPVDLDDDFWGLAPTGLLPATGRVATPLEVRT